MGEKAEEAMIRDDEGVKCLATAWTKLKLSATFWALAALLVIQGLPFLLPFKRCLLN